MRTTFLEYDFFSSEAVNTISLFDKNPILKNMSAYKDNLVKRESIILQN